MRIMKLMKKILTLGLASLLLGQITSLAAAERYEAVNPAYAFSEKTNWRGGRRLCIGSGGWDDRYQQGALRHSGQRLRLRQKSDRRFPAL